MVLISILLHLIRTLKLTLSIKMAFRTGKTTCHLSLLLAEKKKKKVCIFIDSFVRNINQNVDVFLETYSSFEPFTHEIVTGTESCNCIRCCNPEC